MKAFQFIQVLQKAAKDLLVSAVGMKAAKKITSELVEDVTTMDNETIGVTE